MVQVVEKKTGPKLGAPQKAVEGFAHSVGVKVEELQLHKDANGVYHFYAVRVFEKDV